MMHRSRARKAPKYDPRPVMPFDSDGLRMTDDPIDVIDACGGEVPDTFTACLEALRRYSRTTDIETYTSALQIQAHP